MQATINTHFVNTCSMADLDAIVQALKITPKQAKTYMDKGVSSLRAYVGTKLANYLSANKVDALDLEVPSMKGAKAEQPKAEQPKANPFAKAGATHAKQGKYVGPYTVVRDGRRSEIQRNSAIYTALMTCNTFEQFYATAPAKETFTRVSTGGVGVNTPSQSIGYAIKNGWVVLPTA